MILGGKCLYTELKGLQYLAMKPTMRLFGKDESPSIRWNITCQNKGTTGKKPPRIKIPKVAEISQQEFFST